MLSSLYKLLLICITPFFIKILFIIFNLNKYYIKNFIFCQLLDIKSDFKSFSTLEVHIILCLLIILVTFLRLFIAKASANSFPIAFMSPSTLRSRCPLTL